MVEMEKVFEFKLKVLRCFEVLLSKMVRVRRVMEVKVLD